LTRGLVGDVEFGFLPTPNASTTAILTLLFQLPILIRLWYIPTPDMFINAVTLTGYASFMFGYHVHEKAILMVLIPLALTTSSKDKRFLKHYCIASLAGIFSLFPLVYADTEQVTKVILVVMYFLYTSENVEYTWIERVYILGFVGVYVYMTFIHTSIFGSTFQFLPLMICSVYTSLGITTTFINLYILSLQ
jgi:alpha-1,3-glucosyltransferase